MARLVLSVAGAVVGGYFGGPMGASIGASLGGYAGSYIDQKWLFPPDDINNYGPRLNDLKVQVSTYGKPISRVYGTLRLGGNVIWAQPLKETATTTTQSAGGKGGGGQDVSNTTYSYSITLAIAICEGEITGVNRVWADSKLLSGDFLRTNVDNYVVYRGTETQHPDPTMESFDGVGNVPAYRGTAYAVIKDFPLHDYGNRIPNFTFEVSRPMLFSLENKITAITLIPGAGEYVYETTIETKRDSNTMSSIGSTGPINMHIPENRADVLLALDQLKDTLPNVQWIGLVVCWFATSTDAGACTIIPKIEYEANDKIFTDPDNWSVGSFTRETAQMVLTGPDGNPTYGGTPSDKSVIHIIQELKRRNYKIMFYPMIFVDTVTPQSKPWRGRIIPANAIDAEQWFTKTDGYNNFINHYLNLNVDGVSLKNNIDAFVIGSEYIGMTSYMSSPGIFPAVTGFITVAATAKSILPSTVKTIYAADWSEYHHTDDGWYNMDPLWASTYIDVVGIDAYFPITPDMDQKNITSTLIQQYWHAGEGYDYYYSDPDRATQVSFGGDYRYAWKNFPYWYSHTHVNPNGITTAWTPGMKPLWFTEMGFPSVDGCTNQPNVFVDPNSSENGYPRKSKRRIDMKAQRLALEASIDYLNTLSIPGLSVNKFIWTWDARPYPYWPNLRNVWKDSGLWETGHWINGKLGGASLAGIVADLMEQVGVTAYDVSQLTDTVEGFIITSITTVRQAIETLSTAYFFDMVESDGILKFIKRGQPSIVTIPQDDLVPSGASSGKSSVRVSMKTTRAQELDLPQKCTVSYLNLNKNYESNTQIAQRQVTYAVNQLNLQWQLALRNLDARNIAEMLLYSAWVQRNSYQFTLPPRYAYLEPTDVVTVIVNNVPHLLRIVSANMQRTGAQTINAMAEDEAAYDFYMAPGEGGTDQQLPPLVPTIQLTLLDLPALPTDNFTDNFLTMGAVTLDGNWRGAAVYRSDDGGENGGNSYNFLASISGQSIIGVVLTTLNSGITETWDNANTLDVQIITGGLSSVTELAVLNGANAALIGKEVIQFQNAELIDTNTYRLSRLLRGRLGTEDQTEEHGEKERFVLLDRSLLRFPVPVNAIGLTRYYKPVSIGATLITTEEQPFTYEGRALKPYSPVHIASSRNSSSDLTITWVRRTRVGGEWRDGVDVPLAEESERYEVDIMDGSNVVRTISNLTSPTAIYTATEQTADFGSPQSSVAAKIYQLSATVGRGIAREVVSL